MTIQRARSRTSYEASGRGRRRGRSRWELLLSITSPVSPVTPRIRKNEPPPKWQRRQPREEEKPAKSHQRGQAATRSRSSLCSLPVHATSSTPGVHSPHTSSLFLNYGNARPQKPKALSCPDRLLTAWITCFSAPHPSTHRSTLTGANVHGAGSWPPNAPLNTPEQDPFQQGRKRRFRSQQILSSFPVFLFFFLSLFIFNWRITAL